jgi:hypothetical protein
MLEAIADSTQSAVDMTLKIAGDVLRSIGGIFRA